MAAPKKLGVMMPDALNKYMVHWSCILVFSIRESNHQMNFLYLITN